MGETKRLYVNNFDGEFWNRAAATSRCSDVTLRSRHDVARRNVTLWWHTVVWRQAVVKSRCGVVIRRWRHVEVTSRCGDVTLRWRHVVVTAFTHCVRSSSHSGRDGTRMCIVACRPHMCSLHGTDSLRTHQRLWTQSESPLNTALNN